MVKHFLYIFLILPFLVFTQKKEVLHQEHFKNGKIQHEWYILNNHPVKHWKTFYLDSSSYYQRNYNSFGKITSEGWYKDDMKNGYTVEYFKDSCVAKGYYKQGFKDDSWEYSTNKHLDSIGNYNLNKPTNIWLYYKNNFLIKERKYSNNCKNYILKSYHKNGKLQTKGKFVNNKKDGYWEYYSEQQTLISCGLFKNDSKEGYWKYYSDQQTLISCGPFKNNLRDGYWKYYSDQTILISSGSFKNDLKDGYWHYFSDTGILLEQGNFINNKKTKWWSFFKKNGELSHKCQLKEGLLNGYCIYYDGHKIIKGEYFKKGVKVNEWDNWSAFKQDYKKLND